MRHSRSLLALTTGFLLAFAGAVRAVEANSVIVSMEQSGDTITLSKSQPLIVRLPAQFGTGYVWEVLNPGRAPLRLADTQIDRSAVGIPGGTETEVFRFEPTEVGSGEINFVYRQPWVTGQPPQRRFTVHVIVSGQGSP